MKNSIAFYVDQAEKEAKKQADEFEKLRRQYADALATIRHLQSTEKNRRKVHHIPTQNHIGRRKWSTREAAFLKKWRAENNRIGNQRGVLESILSERPNDFPANLSQRDAMVAATVITWLGTNCGQCFLHEVAKDIESPKSKARQKRINEKLFTPTEPKP